MPKSVGRIFAWVVTLGLLAYVLSSVSPAELMRAVKMAAGWTVPVLAVLLIVVYLADSFAIWRTFGWFLARLSYGEVLVVRGATYLLALVNYALGQGAIIYFVHRSRGVPVMRGTAAVLLIMGINVLLLLLLASIGLKVAPEVPHALVLIVVVAYAGLAVYLILVAWKPHWLVARPLFDVLLGAGLSGHLKAALVRVPHIASLLALSYASLRAFGIQVPFTQAVLFLPMVYFVAVLPISVQGLGTTQVLMVNLFAKYAPGTPAFQKATVLASSLTTQAIALGVQIVIGLVCLRSHQARNLAPPESTAPTI